MKYIGFIKEHNPINEAISFQIIRDYNSINDRLFLDKIIEYLSNGELILAWMGYVFDLENNKPIGPDSYYTDGIWVWPSYFPYYLNKYPNYLLDKDFVSHLSSNQFKIDSNKNNFDKSNIEKQLSLKLNEHR